MGRRRAVPAPASTTSGRREPDAAFRSNFIVGYPGETEDDHDRCSTSSSAAQLDWCGFFAYSREEGTYAAGLDGASTRAGGRSGWPSSRELQDGITAAAATG